MQPDGPDHRFRELGKRRHIVLESDDRVLDVVGVDFQNAGCVGQCGVADGNIISLNKLEESYWQPGQEKDR